MSAWTSDDIEQLTRYYTKGFSIKKISKLLKRTPTALHKAISRLKLHALRPPKEDLYFSENGLPIPPVKEKKHLLYFKKLFSVCLNEEWVTFEKVEEFLKNYNFVIKPMMHYQGSKESLYSMNRRIVTKAQILLQANKIRVEEKKTPFKVMDVSY
jgi:hypothetical protein